MTRSRLLLIVLLVGGCDAATPTSNERACVFSELAVKFDAPSPSSAPLGMCLPRDGIDGCVVVEEDASGTCAEREGRRAIVGDPTRCRLLPSSGTFVFVPDSDGCRRYPTSTTGPALSFHDLVPGTHIHLTCPRQVRCESTDGGTPDAPPEPTRDLTRWRDGETPSRVGTACRLSVELCFDARDIHLEPHSDACGGLPCMALGVDGCDRFDGEPVFCTCRCSSLAGDPAVPLCRCPSDMQCVEELLSLEGTGIGGGYCVPCVRADGDRPLSSSVLPSCEE